MNPFRLRLCCMALALPLLLGACASPPAASGPWACMTTSGAEERRQQVERDVLPQVVFAGETKPQSITERMAAHKQPGLSVAVIKDGSLDWTAAYGQAQAGVAAVSCDTRFQAGSIAKPVTLMAVLRMARAGKVDLDRDVAAMLRSAHLPPGKQSAERPVTLRNLLAHTSGLSPGGYGGYAQDAALPSLVDIVHGAAPANTPKLEVVQVPGTSLRYSGGGYTLLQLALQDHFNEPFEALMQQWVLKPAGLRSADFTLHKPTPDALFAVGHDAEGRPQAGGWRQHPESAAAGLWATPSDLAYLLIEIWKGFHGRSAVFDQASVRELLAKPFEGHAYGFRLMGEGAEQFIVHYGGTQGYNAGMAINLHTGQGAVYLSNADQGRQVGPEFLNAVARHYGWAQFRESTQVKRGSLADTQLQPLAGRYRFGSNGPRVVVEFASGAGLTLIFPNGDRYALTPIVEPQGGPLQFIHASTGVRAGFEPVAGSEVLGLRLYGDVALREPATAK